MWSQMWYSFKQSIDIAVFAKPMYIYFSMLFLFLGSNDTNQGLHHSGNKSPDRYVI